MRQITDSNITDILGPQSAPCVSIYLPTHKHHPENQQDPIRFRNLIDKAERKLDSQFSENGSAKAKKEILNELQRIAYDGQFWNYRTEGLAVLANAEGCRIFELNENVAELAIVADSFHSLPIIKTLKARYRYHILGLNRHSIKLYEATETAINEIELAEEIPATLQDALGEQLTDAYRAAAPMHTGVPGNRSAKHYGAGVKKDEVELDNQRFFRVVDRAIYEHHSQPTELPLILASLPEHHSLFHSISRNPFLTDKSIDVDPQSVSLNRLHQEAWKVIKPTYELEILAAVDQYRQATADFLASDDLDTIAEAAVEGRIATLLIEENRMLSGRITHDTGKISLVESADEAVDNILDDLVEIVFGMKGDVLILPKEQMPTNTGGAAVFRFRK